MKAHHWISVALVGLVSPALRADWTPTAGFVTTTDVVGVGTATPGQGAGLTPSQESPLHIFSSQNKNTVLLVQNATNDLNVAPTVRTMSDVATQNFQSHASGRTISRFGQTLGGWNEFISVSGNGLILGTIGASPLIFGTAATNRIHITGTGNIGIGTSTPGYKLDVAGTGHFSGAVTVDGNLAAKYQDVAEWVPVSTPVDPGTVVVLDPSRSNQVMPSDHPYDTRVAGVISAQPGLILGESSADKAMVATTGRVKVRVDATEQPIAIGDLLVTSDKPGVAMKSLPIDLGGVAIHRPGTLVGKALEPLTSGEGEILVLLSLQ